MARFIPMPWDEPKVQRWTWEELKTALRYRDQGMNFEQIADRLAEDGFEAREGCEVGWKINEVDRETGKNRKAG